MKAGTVERTMGFFGPSRAAALHHACSEPTEREEEIPSFVAEHRRATRDDPVAVRVKKRSER